MEVSGYLHAPATFLLGKKPGTLWIAGWVGPRAGLDGFGKEKISSAYHNSNPGTIQPVASCYTNYANLVLLLEGLHKFVMGLYNGDSVLYEVQTEAYW
jgi:hypothetical protein